MEEVEHEEELSQVPKKRKKRGLYKRYKYDNTKKVPRQTIYSWKCAQKRYRQGIENDIEVALDAQESGSSTHSYQEFNDESGYVYNETVMEGSPSPKATDDNEDNMLWNVTDSTLFEVQSDSDEYYFSSSGDELWSSSDDDDGHDGALFGEPGDVTQQLSLLLSDEDDEDDVDSAMQLARDKIDEKGSSSTSQASRLEDLLYSFPMAEGDNYNSPLTRAETCAAILAYSLKHCSTYSAMQDLLDLIDLVLPSPNRLPKSVFATKQALTPQDLTESAVYHPFCPNCFQILDNMEIICGSCGRITGNLDVVPFTFVKNKCFYLAGNKECLFVAKTPNNNEKD